MYRGGVVMNLDAETKDSGQKQVPLYKLISPQKKHDGNASKLALRDVDQRAIECVQSCWPTGRWWA